MKSNETSPKVATGPFHYIIGGVQTSRMAYSVDAHTFEEATAMIARGDEACEVIAQEPVSFQIVVEETFVMGSGGDTLPESAMIPGMQIFQPEPTQPVRPPSGPLGNFGGR